MADVDRQAAAWAAEDARVLERTAPRLAESVVASTFAAMEARVPAYADWVYGWLSSLLTAWDLASVGAVEAGTEISAGRFPDRATMHGRLAEVVQQRFEAVVIQPARSNAALVDGWERTMRRLAEFDRRLAAERQQRIERLAAARGIDARPALLRYGLPLLSPTLVETPPPTDLAELALGTAGADGSVDRVLVRSLRPLATRSISVAARIAVLPVAGGALAASVAAANGMFAPALTLTAVSAGVWGIDYAINEADSALTRAAFERDLKAAVRDTGGAAARLAGAHARAAACGALTEALRAAGDCRTRPGVATTGRSG